MTECEVCGNRYDKSFDIIMLGERHTFDCFECAIHALAVRCDHCDCRILGHGLESNGRYYCCAHCARQEDAPQLRDRVDGGESRAPA